MISRAPAANLPIIEALRAMHEGDHHRALAVLHNLDQPGSVLLRARAYFRLGLYDRVATEFSRRSLSYYDIHENVQLHETFACALVEQGDLQRAFEIVERQRAVADSSRIRLLIAFATHLESLIAICAGDFDRSFAAMKASQKALSALPYRDRQKPHHVNPIALLARLHDLEAWHDLLRGDLASQGENSLASAMLAADPRSDDRYLESHLLSNLGGKLIAFPSPKAHAYALSRFESFPWSAHTDAAETRVKSALTNSHRLFGYRAPPRLDKRTAPTLPLRLADTLLKLLFENWADSQAFIDDCKFAVSVALDVKASSMPGPESLDILTLGCIIAPLDLALAQRAQEIFQLHKHEVSKFALFKYSPSVHAKILLFEGSLAKADGRFEEALQCYNASLSHAIKVVGAPWPAITGLERFALTRDDSDIRHARDFVAAFPTSSFSERLRASLTNIGASTPSSFPYLGMYDRLKSSVLECRSDVIPSSG